MGDQDQGPAAGSNPWASLQGKAKTQGPRAPGHKFSRPDPFGPPCDSGRTLRDTGDQPAPGRR